MGYVYIEKAYLKELVHAVMEAFINNGQGGICLGCHNGIP